MILSWGFPERFRYNKPYGTSGFREIHVSFQTNESRVVFFGMFGKIKFAGSHTINLKYFVDNDTKLLSRFKQV